jgi:glutamate dehydrogenase/leucine dehydrogenase
MEQAMESLIRGWPGESVIIHFDQATGAWIFIAIHSTRLGPAIGGTRMKRYPTPRAALQDALNLAAGMTYKFAVAGFPGGGGKAVIAIPPDLNPDSRLELLRRYGKLIHQLGGLFQTGPDVGTSSADMDVIAETGAPYVFSLTPAAGGAGDSGPYTALGVLTGIQITCDQLFGDDSLAGRRILVQGAGNVGRELIKLLQQNKAEIMFSDIDGNTIQHFRDELGLQFVAADAVYDTPCDIFAPCALGSILNKDTIPRLKCRAVAGAANNQLASPDDPYRLQQRQILYAPDFVLNIGGAMAITGMEARGWSRSKAEAKVIQSVRENLPQVFQTATSEGITTEAAARRLAETRLAGLGEV